MDNQSPETPPSHPFQELPSTPSKPASHVHGSHPFTHNLRRQKLRNYLIAGLAGLVVISGLAYYFLNAGKGQIVILDTNKEIKITLNNQPVKSSLTDKGYIIPAFAGTYRLEITKTNYLPFVQNIALGRGQTLEIRPAYAFQPTSKESAVSTVDYVRPSADQKSVFYLGDNRQTIYRMNINDQTRVPLTDSPLHNVTDVEWSSQPDVALITQTDGTYLREIPSFDYTTQTLVKLGGPEIISPIWDPLNPERLAFAYFTAAGERSLIFSDKRLTDMTRKADLSAIPNPKLIWSSNDSYILIIGRSADYSQDNLWLYKTADGSLTQLTTSGNVVDASFSPDNDIILYESHTTDASNPVGATLSTIHPDGSNNKNLDIDGKVARVAWKDNDSFYLPNDGSNALNLYTLSGQKEQVVFAFPSVLSIKGMFYFTTSKTLIFYTDSSIYTVELAL